MNTKALLLFLTCTLSLSELYAQDIAQLAEQKPVTLHGNLGLGIGTYTVSGIPARQRDFTYLLNGAPTLTIYGVAFPFSVVMSDQERRYTQPFNQYGISPTYKWITVHGGWRSMEFSPFTLAGHNFLGGGVELNPGKLRFGMMYGRFKKAIEEDTNQPTYLADQASYRRTGFSTKLGLGTERNHVDLIMLKAKDDIHSLKNTPSSTFMTPAENLVIGISSKFTFFKRFVFALDASGSAYTRNIQSDTLKNLKLGKYDFVRDWITLNASTRVSTAGETSLGYQGQTYTIKAKYRRVDPDYQSMGAYHFETDVENYTLEGGIRLFKNQLQMNGSFGLQFDNLLHEKQVQSKRKIGSFNIGYNKPAYGIDLRYSNYGITQDRGINPMIDMLRVTRTNHNFSSVYRYTINRESINHGFILVGNIQSLVDLNEYTKPNSKSNSKTVNLSYQIGLPQKALNANATVNYTRADYSMGNSVFYGPTVGVGKSFFKSVLSTNASVSYQFQENASGNIGNILSTNLMASGRIGKRNSVNVSLNYLDNDSKDAALPSFRELRTNLSVVHSF